MALKTYKPTTPGLRQLAIVDRSELHKGKPVKALTDGKSEKGGRNNAGRITVRFRGGGHKQTYRIVDFKRRKLDVAGEGRAAGIRSQPHELHRADQIRRRRAGLHHRAAAPRGRRRGGRRRAGRREAGQRHAARQHPGRHDRPQCRDEDRQGRRDRPLGRLLCADRRPRPGLCLAAPELRRAAPGSRPVLRHGRRGVEPRPHERLARQGGPQPLARPASAQSRRHHEPGRPSAWRRRRPHLGRPSSGHALGQADQGQEDPLEQVDRQVHRRLAARAQEEEAEP